MMNTSKTKLMAEYRNITLGRPILSRKKKKIIHAQNVNKNNVLCLGHIRSNVMVEKCYLSIHIRIVICPFCYSS